MMWIIAILGVAAIVMAGLYVWERNNHQILQARFDGLAMSLEQAGKDVQHWRDLQTKSSEVVSSQIEEIRRITSHNASLRETVISCRQEVSELRAGLSLKNIETSAQQAEIQRLGGITADQAEEISVAAELNEGHRTEIERLTSEFEKLTAEYNQLGLKMPAFRPKAVRWSGPDGARAQIERALVEQRSQSTGATAAQQTKVRKKSKD